MAVIPGKDGRSNAYQFSVSPHLEQQMEEIAMAVEGKKTPSAALQRSVMEAGAQQKLAELNQARLGETERTLSTVQSEVAGIKSDVADVKAGLDRILQLLEGGG